MLALGSHPHILHFPFKIKEGGVTANVLDV